LYYTLRDLHQWLSLSLTTILFTIIIFRKCHLPTYIITFTHETDGEPDLLPSEHPNLSASIFLETISGKSNDLYGGFVVLRQGVFWAVLEGLQGGSPSVANSYEHQPLFFLSHSILP